MVAITYQQQAAALAARDQYWLQPHIDQLPDGHPTKRTVALMIAYARDVITGQLPGPYTGAKAEYYARTALMPQHQIRDRLHLPDQQLADEFGAPLEQVQARRTDPDVAPTM